MNCLIVGGTSGLGLSLARLLTKTHSVHVTGRRTPTEDTLTFHPLDLSNPETLFNDIDQLIDKLPQIDLLIYAAGFFQEGTVTDLSQQQIDEMFSVGLSGAIYSTRQLLDKQGELPEFVAITSTSQWTPRLYEPVYTAVKAGLAAYANSLSLDPRVKKTLVAGPAGMDTNFWSNTMHDTSTMLSPEWVAEQIQSLREGDYAYKFAKILRQPARVEVEDVRAE